MERLNIMRYTEFPECWEEMTPRQYKYFLKLFFRMMNDQRITPREVLCDFADFILGRKKFLFPQMQERYLYLVFQLADNLSWVFETDDAGNTGINYCTTENIMPRLGKLVGPLSHGSDITFEEYRCAVDFYNRFTMDHDPALLDALVGILYRKPNRKVRRMDFDGSFREPFNRNRIDFYALKASKIPDHLKYGVYLWFGYLCRFIVDGGVFTIEGNDVCFSGIFERSVPDSDSLPENSIGMLSVLFTLADTGTFGDEKQTDKTELLKILLKLLHDKETAEKIKRQ